MALPSSGPMSMSQVNTELKTTGSINLGREDVRKLAKVLSGTIKMSDLRGKSAEIVYTKIDSFEGGGQAPVTPQELIFKFLNGDLAKRNIPISLTKEEINNLRKGSIYYSEDKIYKIVIVDIGSGRPQPSLYFVTYTVDVYKGE